MDYGVVKKHLLYLKYVLRHKWYVYKACVRIGNPVLVFWRGIVHDWQKFTPAEWTPYVLSFYGPWSYNARPQWLVDDFDRAWLHHQRYGPHHWQYWLLNEDSGGVKPLRMPDNYVDEMVADWIGASTAINGFDDTRNWYEKNKLKMQLHPSTRQRVEWLVRRTCAANADSE